MASTGWNWDKVQTGWSEPAEEVYYLLHRWKELGLRRVLDLGCGIGRHALLFAQHGFAATGLDASDTGLRRLREAARLRGLPVATVHADVVALPLEDAAFDAVLAFHSIYHVDTPGMERAIHEACRVLRPGGEIYLTMISKAAATYSDGTCEVVDRNVRREREEDGTVLPHFYADHDDLARLLSGLEILRIRHVQDFWQVGSDWHYFAHARLTGRSPGTSPAWEPSDRQASVAQLLRDWETELGGRS